MIAHIRSAQHRKFHNKGAFAIVAYTSIALLAYIGLFTSMLSSKTIHSASAKVPPHNQASAPVYDAELSRILTLLNLREMALVVFSLCLAFTSFTPLLFFCAKKNPRLLIHSSFALLPILSVAAWFFAGRHIYGLLWIAVSVLFPAILYYTLRGYIDFACDVFPKIVEVLLSHAFTLISLDLLSLILQVQYLAFVLYSFCSGKSYDHILAFIYIFYGCIFEICIHYAMQVLITSLTLLTAIGQSKHTSKKSFYILLNALGSISMSALLLLPVTIMKYTFLKLRSTKDMGQEERIDMSISDSTPDPSSRSLLQTLQILADRSNELTFSYIAQRGREYVYSTSRTYHKFKNTGANLKVALRVLQRICILFAFLVAGIFYSFGCTILYLFSKFIGSSALPVSILFTLVLAICMAVRLYNMLSAASHSVIYISVFNSDADLRAWVKEDFLFLKTACSKLEV